MTEGKKYTFLSNETLIVGKSESLQGKLNSYEMLPNADVFFVDLVEEIGRSTLNVDLQFHTFEGDVAGEPVAQALIAARKRGINIRLMVDDYINLAHNDHYILVPRLNRNLQHSIVSEWRQTNQMFATMRKNGIEVQITNPLGFLKHRALWRDHRKLVVIDSSDPNRALAYTGGINISEHNASWNDFMVKMRGDMVPLLQTNYDKTWQQKNEGGIAEYSEGLVVTDTREHSIIIPVVVKLIDQAKQKVIIESPYLWGKSIGQALENAAQRGVDVSVIVPLHNHKRLLVPSKRSLRKMRTSGINIYRFQENGGMTHAKAVLTDSIGTFGSNNFNEFLGGRIGEICITTSNESLVFQLEQFLKHDIETSSK